MKNLKNWEKNQGLISTCNSFNFFLYLSFSTKNVKILDRSRKFSFVKCVFGVKGIYFFYNFFYKNVCLSIIDNYVKKQYLKKKVFFLNSKKNLLSRFINFLFLLFL